jgi:5-hydroxyisourate hydrolase
MALTTHVLDVSRGTPAEGVAVELHALRDGQRVPIASALTNRDGRTDVPLGSTTATTPLEQGIYELTFHVADYFRRTGVALDTPPFLGDIVIRVGIADAQAHYHVPLLVSPYAYSTYRGS